MSVTNATKWYIISEAIADGESVERHRIRAQTTEDQRMADSAKALAEEWARSYSTQTGVPTTIDIVWLDDAGQLVGAEVEGFYYDPEYPQRDPYQKYGY